MTEPDFENGEQAAAFVDELATLLRFLDVCSANMSTGELRVDINISRGPTRQQQGPIVEVNNVNSLRGIRHAVDFELRRQRQVVEGGGEVVNEPRSFDLMSK